MSIKMQVILTGKDIIDFCPGKEMSPNITVLLCDTILPIKNIFQHFLLPINVYSSDSILK